MKQEFIRGRIYMFLAAVLPGVCAIFAKDAIQADQISTAVSYIVIGLGTFFGFGTATANTDLVRPKPVATVTVKPDLTDLLPGLAPKLAEAANQARAYVNVPDVTAVIDNARGDVEKFATEMQELARKHGIGISR